MLKNLVFLLLVLSSFSSYATETVPQKEWRYEGPYYGQSLEKLSSNKETLRESLFKILHWNHRVLEDAADEIVESCPDDAVCYRPQIQSYKTARLHLFISLSLEEDENQNLFIEDVYCPRIFTNDDFIGVAGITETKEPFHEIMNTEHTWPQSRFNPQYRNESKSDLHHLFPSDSKLNQFRGNYEFAIVDPERQSRELKCRDLPAESKLGKAAPVEGLEINESKLYFEPPANHRGNIARALFYFAVRYKMSIDALEEHYLRLWNKEDPVDEEERLRNDLIFEFQKTRNPFIDLPQLADQIEDF